MDDPGRQRWRARLDEYAAIVAIVALLLAALGGGLIYITYVDPGEVSEENTVANWQTTPGFDHQAAVQRPNLVFPTGAVLQDRSLYFTQITPILEGSLGYGVSGEPGEVDVSIDATLVLRSVSNEGGEYWRVGEDLASESGTVATGERVSASFDLNVSNVLARIDAIQSDLDSSVGSTEVLVQGATSATGTVAGEPFSHSDTYTMTINPGESTYTIETSAESQSFARTETVTREETYGPIRMAAGPVLVIIGLLGAIGIGVARHRGTLAVTEGEREVLDFYSQREEFDEWITRGTVPPDAKQGPTIAVDDLEGLVDVAIDSEARVIEDVTAGAYYVLKTDRVYTFAPPATASIPD